MFSLEYMAEHGCGLPTGESGCGSLKNLLMFRAARTSKGFCLSKAALAGGHRAHPVLHDGGPIPDDAEGAPISTVIKRKIRTW